MVVVVVAAVGERSFFFAVFRFTELRRDNEWREIGMGGCFFCG